MAVYIRIGQVQFIVLWVAHLTADPGVRSFQFGHIHVTFPLSADSRKTGFQLLAKICTQVLVYCQRKV